MEGTDIHAFGPFELPATQPHRVPRSLATEIEAAFVSRQKAKLRSEIAPNLPFSIDIDSYLAFSTYLKSSKRILALLGSGLSAASGIDTFVGAGGFWRTHDVRRLSTNGAFKEDPSLLWWFYTVRRREALGARPNKGHLAVAALAQRMSDAGMLTICQNIDGELRLPRFNIILWMAC
jgi:hypothetical protein